MHSFSLDLTDFSKFENVLKLFKSLSILSPDSSEMSDFGFDVGGGFS